MSEGAEPTPERRGKWSPWAIAAALLLLLIFGVIAVGTLRGYFFVSAEDAAKQEEENKKKEEEEKKQKSEFDISTPIVMPSDPKSHSTVRKTGALGSDQPIDDWRTIAILWAIRGYRS